MTEYKIKLNTGLEIEFQSEDFNADDFAENFNNQSVLFVVVGGSFLNKHSIIYVTPQHTDDAITDYQVYLNNQELLDLNVDDDFSEQDFIEKLNTQDKHYVAFGGAVFQKHMLNTLIKLK